MQSLVRARQFKDVFTVRQEGDHVQQSIRRKDVVDASNSTRVVFCAGPFARRRLNRRRLCLDIHFDDSFFFGGGALICGRDKIETRFRLYVERRSARRRGKERKNSLELFLDEGDRRPRRPRRRLVRDPLFFFVVEAKRHPRDGDPVFSALFFLRKLKQNREKK
tara:strand:- start:118 stop:609 length:492 start_codon:yes stop_codon:yes gene_type:complete